MDQSEAIRKVLDSVDVQKEPWLEHHGCIVTDKKFKWVRWNGEEVYTHKYVTPNIGKKTAQYLVKLHNYKLDEFYRTEEDLKWFMNGGQIKKLPEPS